MNIQIHLRVWSWKILTVSVGMCTDVRDYIHVSDLKEIHVRALEFSVQGKCVLCPKSRERGGAIKQSGGCQSRTVSWVERFRSGSLRRPADLGPGSCCEALRAGTNRNATRSFTNIVKSAWKLEAKRCGQAQHSVYKLEQNCRQKRNQNKLRLFMLPEILY